MYVPPAYRNSNHEELRHFISENSFGMLVSQVGDKPVASHIPLELHKDAAGKDILRGHLARANPQWQDFPKEGEVLAIFVGPHHYISSSWYQDEEVPTWNYIAVHVYGTIKIMDDATLWESLKALVDKYESMVSNPVSLEKMSKKTLRQVRGIVGFEITITDIQAAYKLSQGRESDHENIKSELRMIGEPSAVEIAKAMDGRKKES